MSFSPEKKQLNARKSALLTLRIKLPTSRIGLPTLRRGLLTLRIGLDKQQCLPGATWTSITTDGEARTALLGRTPVDPRIT